MSESFEKFFSQFQSGQPLVIETVDSEEKINALLPTLDKMMGGGLVTLEKVKVLHYRADDGEK